MAKVKINDSELQAISEHIKKAQDMMTEVEDIWGKNFDNLYNNFTNGFLDGLYKDAESQYYGLANAGYVVSNTIGGLGTGALAGSVAGSVIPGLGNLAVGTIGGIAGAVIGFFKGITHCVKNPTGVKWCYDAKNVFIDLLTNCANGNDDNYTAIQNTKTKLDNMQLAMTKIKTKLNEFNQLYANLNATAESLKVKTTMASDGLTVLSVDTEVTIDGKKVNIATSDALNAFYTYSNTVMSGIIASDYLERTYGYDVDYNEIIKNANAFMTDTISSDLYTHEFIESVLPEYNPSETKAYKAISGATGIDLNKIESTLNNNSNIAGSVALFAGLLGSGFIGQMGSNAKTNAISSAVNTPSSNGSSYHPTNSSNTNTSSKANTGGSSSNSTNSTGTSANNNATTNQGTKTPPTDTTTKKLKDTTEKTEKLTNNSKIKIDKLAGAVGTTAASSIFKDRYKELDDKLDDLLQKVKELEEKKNQTNNGENPEQPDIPNEPNTPDDNTQIGNDIILDEIVTTELPKTVEDEILEKDFDELARDELEFSQKYEDIINHRNDIISDIETKFNENDLDSIKDELKEYGFSSAEIDAIVEDKYRTIKAILEGDQNAQLATKARELAAAANVENYTSKYEAKPSYDELISDEPSKTLMLASEDENVVKLNEEMKTAEESYKKAINETNLSLAEVNTNKEKMNTLQTQFTTEYGEDTTKWSQEAATEYNNSIKIYNESVTKATNQMTNLENTKNVYATAKNDFTTAKNTYYEKVIKDYKDNSEIVDDSINSIEPPADVSDQINNSIFIDKNGMTIDSSSVFKEPSIDELGKIEN